MSLTARADLRAAIKRLLRATNGPVVGGAQHGAGNLALIEVERRDVELLLALVHANLTASPVAPPRLDPRQR